MFGHFERTRGCHPDARHAMRHRGRHGFGHWGFAGEWGGPNQRGRGRTRMFDSGELRLVLLKLVADEPRHGYDLIRAIEELTGGAYAPSPGVVYPTLTLLSDMGFIEQAPGEGARKPFTATEAGQAELDANRETVDALIARLSQIGEDRQRGDARSVRRAMGNLRQALIDRLSDGDADEELLHKIVAILDESAQKIERL